MSYQIKNAGCFDWTPNHLRCRTHREPHDRDERERAAAVADELVGTTQNLAKVATEAEVASPAFMAALAEHVFECEECGWWILVDEEGDEAQHCDECRPHE